MEYGIISIVLTNIPDACKAEIRSFNDFIPNKVEGFYTASETVTEAGAEEAIRRQLEVITRKDKLFRRYSSLGGKITLYITLGKEENDGGNDSILFSPAILAIMNEYGITLGVD